MKEVKQIDFNSFPHNLDCTQIEGKLFLTDNVDLPDDYVPMTINAHGPVKLKMSLIFICTQGHMDININLQEYKLIPKHVATITANSFMQITEISKDFKGYLIAISQGFLDYSQDFKIGLAMINQTREYPLAPLSDSNMQDAIDIYTMMKRKLREPNFKYKEQVAKNLLNILRYNGLQAIVEYLGKKRPLITNRKEDMLNQFITIVRDNYKTERQLSFYSTQMGVTPKYLSTVIKEISGKYATDWINEYILLEAKALLKNSDMTIKEICMGLNFSSVSVFTKYFKQNTGYTPKEYRES